MIFAEDYPNLSRFLKPIFKATSGHGALTLWQPIIDELVKQDIHKFILIGENVLNYHGDDNCYYEEWWDDIKDEEGWIAFVNFRPHVIDEMVETELQYYVNLDDVFGEINWRPQPPNKLFQAIDTMINKGIKKLVY